MYSLMSMPKTRQKVHDSTDLLRVLLRVGEQGRHVEHDLVLLEDGVYRVGPGHVVPDVQASAVAVPALQPNLVSLWSIL